MELHGYINYVRKQRAGDALSSNRVVREGRAEYDVDGDENKNT